MTDAEGNARYYKNQPWDLTYTITTSAVTDHQVRIYLAEDYRLNLKLKNVQIDRTNIGYDFNQLKGAISFQQKEPLPFIWKAKTRFDAKPASS